MIFHRRGHRERGEELVTWCWRQFLLAPKAFSPPGQEWGIDRLLAQSLIKRCLSTNRTRCRMIPIRLTIAILICFTRAPIAYSQENAPPLLADGKPLRQLGESEFRLTADGLTERFFCFSDDQKLLAGTNGRELKLWSFPEGKLQFNFSSIVQSGCIAFAADKPDFGIGCS